jgi:hypothetical protein
MWIRIRTWIPNPDPTLNSIDVFESQISIHLSTCYLKIKLQLKIPLSHFIYEYKRTFFFFWGGGLLDLDPGQAELQIRIRPNDADPIHNNTKNWQMLTILEFSNTFNGNKISTSVTMPPNME